MFRFGQFLKMLAGTNILSLIGRKKSAGLLGGGLSMAPFGAWHPSPRAAPPNVWQVVDLPAPEGPLDQPIEELIARVQAELDEAARA